MEIGYLEYETACYGTAYYKNGDINYYICEKEEMMDKFMVKCLNENIIPTPVKYYYKRYDLLKQSVEYINTIFRYEVARKLQSAYPQIFFDAVLTLTEPLSSNEAYPILDEIAGQLESCFDMNQLQLFDGLLEMLLRARQISYEGYLLLNQWLKKEYEKVAVEPIASGVYRKTYSGFAYKKLGEEIKYYCDAYPYIAKEKQEKYLRAGHIVTPILTATQYGSSFKELDKSKLIFENDLRRYLGSTYIALMELLRTLPAAVDAEKYHTFMERIQETGSRQAIEAFRFYGVLWNIV